MTLREIVAAWLKAHHYDGLAGDGCGCLRLDLMPCGEPSLRCVAGRRVECTGHDCEYGPGPHWHVVPANLPRAPL